LPKFFVESSESFSLSVLANFASYWNYKIAGGLIETDNGVLSCLPKESLKPVLN